MSNIDLVRSVLPQLSYLDEWDVILRLSGPHGVLLAKNGGLAGFSVWYETLPGMAYIWMIGVLPEYRGKGIGSTLLDETIAEVRRRGYTLVWVKISRDKRWWIQAHIRRGFRVFERIVEGDKIVYKLVLPLSQGIQHLL